MENLTEANKQHIRRHWQLKNREEKKWKAYYDSGGDRPNESYLTYLNTEYVKYLLHCNIDPNDRMIAEELWLFINTGKENTANAK